MTIWECEIKKEPDEVIARLRFLMDQSPMTASVSRTHSDSLRDS